MDRWLEGEVVFPTVLALVTASQQVWLGVHSSPGRGFPLHLLWEELLTAHHYLFSTLAGNCDLFQLLLHGKYQGLRSHDAGDRAQINAQGP